jgi:hypothetical protein
MARGEELTGGEKRELACDRCGRPAVFNHGAGAPEGRSGLARPAASVFRPVSPCPRIELVADSGGQVDGGSKVSAYDLEVHDLAPSSAGAGNPAP